MIKVIGLMKRRPDLTHQAFRDYYENVHRLIGEKYLLGHAVHYSRRYVTPFSDPLSCVEGERSFDCVTEMWYPDRAAYDAFNEVLARPEVQDEINSDCANFLDVPALRYFFVEECESTL